MEIDRVAIALDPEPHPFEAMNLASIESNWEKEKEAKPALYDGMMMLHSELRLEGASLVGRCHAVRYATLMWWRRKRPVADAEHAFAHAALVSSDNALVAIRMASHTAAAGRVYFASGSFEPPDFRDGAVDVLANMVREVGEETGLDLRTARPGRRYALHAGAHGTAIYRCFRFDRTAVELASDIAAFVATEKEPEIEGPVVIRSASDRPAGLSPHMLPFMEWHFARE
ncbi:MAG: hypothetical protein AB7I79_08680 [Rhizobiaceae bacterium]